MTLFMVISLKHPPILTQMSFLCICITVGARGGVEAVDERERTGCVGSPDAEPPGALLCKREIPPIPIARITMSRRAITARAFLELLSLALVDVENGFDRTGSVGGKSGGL